MKIKLFTLLLGVFTLTLTAADSLNVSCTTYPLWLFAKNITKGISGVRTDLLIPATTGCPHDYVLTPQDMQKLGRKNMILIRNGAGLDDFLLKALARVNPDVPIITVTDGMKLLKSDAAHEHHHEEEADHEEPGHHHEKEYENPHAFASPFEAMTIVRNMTEGLCRHDRAHAAAYRENAEKYLKKLEELCREFTEASRTFRSGNIVTMHSAFDYLASALKLKIVMELNGEENGLSAAKLREAAKIIRKEKACLILSEPQYSDKGAKALARECGIPCESLDPVASGPSNAAEDYYEKTMKKNLFVLKERLSK